MASNNTVNAGAAALQDRTGTRADDARTWFVAYVLTFLATCVGPSALGVLSILGIWWRVETVAFWSLVAQVIPVLLLAVAVERRLFGARQAHGSLAAVVFATVVGTAAIAEILALVLLAFPCSADQLNCSDTWPSFWADTATVFASAAVPGALTLLILSGAIQSGLPFDGNGKGRRWLGRIAQAALFVTATVPLGSVGAVALLAGRIGEGALAAAVAAVLGVKLRVSDGQRTDDVEEIDVELFGHAVARLTGSGHVEGIRAEEDPADAHEPARSTESPPQSPGSEL